MVYLDNLAYIRHISCKSFRSHLFYFLYSYPVDFPPQEPVTDELLAGTVQKNMLKATVGKFKSQNQRMDENEQKTLVHQTTPFWSPTKSLITLGPSNFHHS